MCVVYDMNKGWLRKDRVKFKIVFKLHTFDCQ